MEKFYKELVEILETPLGSLMAGDFVVVFVLIFAIIMCLWLLSQVPWYLCKIVWKWFCIRKLKKSNNV